MVVSESGFTELADTFLIFCRSRGLAKRTIETYGCALQSLGGFLRDQTKGEVPTKHHLRAYTDHLLDRRLSRSTISIQLRAIRVFCNWLEREGLVEVNPFIGVDIPRLPRSLPRSLDSRQIAKLVAACRRNTWAGIRNHTMVLTFIDTGVRLSELIDLDLADISPGDWGIRVRHGKGDKERHVFMGRKLHRAMREWLSARGVSVAEDALFISRNGTRLDKRNVQRILQRIADRAGLQDVPVSPHRLRHSFAVQYIRNGGDPFSLQRILGHSNASTTSIYVNVAGKGLREAHAKASPVDRLEDR